MKNLQKYSVLLVVVWSNAMYGMLVSKKCVNNLKTTMNYGLVTATMPQRAKGSLGNFRLDKQYGARDYLGQYIAFNNHGSLGKAVWQGFNSIESAYKQFLSHNSSAAIHAALNNNIIDKDYAVQSLYFTHTVAAALQYHIEFQQDFAQKYANDSEQYIWVDNDAFNLNRRQLLHTIEREQKAVVDLVEFLQQKPVNKDYKVKSSTGIFKKEKSSHGWSFTYPFTYHLSTTQNRIQPHRIAHAHDGVLGTFNPQREYSIQSYLQKYLEACDDKVEWRALKKAYNDFLFYNMPSRIRQSFENSKNVTKEEVTEALLFTSDVASAMKRYLDLDWHAVDCTFYDNEYKACNCWGEYGPEDELTDRDVQLFAQLGVEPATTAQTWDGLLGNFALTKQQNGKAQCTIQDYLCKYIARNLQIPEDAVVTEATFLDIKKAFESFVGHNHPDAILRDFENELISKQHAKNALEFTFWVANAFKEYLDDFNDDSYEMELFELFWQMNRMRDKAVGMRFVEKGEWNSTTKE